MCHKFLSHLIQRIQFCPFFSPRECSVITPLPRKSICLYCFLYQSKAYKRDELKHSLGSDSIANNKYHLEVKTSSLEQDNSLSKSTDWREWLKDLVRYKDTTLIASILAENLEKIHKEFTFLDGDIIVAFPPQVRYNLDAQNTLDSA